MTMSVTTLSSTVCTNLVRGHVGRGEECEAAVCTVYKLSSTNFIYMNHGTLYMVSVRHTQPHVVQAFIYSVNTILVQTADVVSIMSQGPSILAE